MTIKAINDIVEYNNLVPILLVFEIFSRIINDDIFTLSTTKKIKAINIVIIEVIKLYAKR